MMAPDNSFVVVDMHTGGEPVRIVMHGYPDIPGETILAKRRYVCETLDQHRRLLMFEPRGHADMYGALLVPPSTPEADLAVLFMHNEGYSTMCGHAVIALGRYAIDAGLVAPREPETAVTIECPCGLVRAVTQVTDGRAGDVSFDSVPAFAFVLSRPVTTPTYGPVLVDIGFGGAFYALVPAADLGLDVRRSRVRDLIDAASEITVATKEQVALTHPDADDLAFLYGTILTDGADGSDGASANICVFADAQVDRSPTGSGVTARLAVQHARGEVMVGAERLFESVTGSQFSGAVVEKTRAGPHRAVRVRVSGRAHYMGRSELWHEPGDQIGRGFLLR